MIAVAVWPLVLLAAPVAAQTPLVEWQEVAIPGVCTLRVAVPHGWSAELRSPLEGTVHLRLTPDAAPPSEVLITGLVPKGDQTLKSTGDIKRAARKMGEEMLPDSTERKIELERVTGVDGSGFFYSLTDKRTSLPEGGFRHMTQGIMAVGPLRVAVTVLDEGPASAAKGMAFDLLRTAQCTDSANQSRK
jgi:hypothetical protein